MIGANENIIVVRNRISRFAASSDSDLLKRVVVG